MTKTTGASIETWGGIALALSALLALIAANSGFAAAYSALLATPVHVTIGALKIHKTLLLWINDGLMAIFFLLVGLEIKRELVIGELSNRRKAMLPLIAASGGFVLPALIFVAINLGHPGNLRAWAVPTATDIAFVVGLIAALGRLVPVSLKVLVLAIAIIDDLMAVVVIALFYTAELAPTMLGLAGLAVIALWLFGRFGVRSVAVYVLVGIGLWVAVLKSGAHATLAGVILGFMIPLERHGPERESLLEHMEHALKPWVTFLIVPVFAFANAGVPLGGMGWSALTAPLTLGIIAGLFFGKQFGIFAAIWASVRLGFSPKPERASWMQIYAVSALCGIGFTMSLFIGSLSFEDPALQDLIRLGVLLGSFASAVLGVLLLKRPAARD